MTVGELKKLCDNLPDNMPVCLHAWTHRGTGPLEPIPYVDSLGAVIEHGRVVICAYKDQLVKYK